MKGKFLGLLSPVGRKKGGLMAVSDPVADMLTRLRNANNAKHDWVDIPFSKLKLEIAKILDEEGYVRSLETRKLDNNIEVIRVYLKYNEEGISPINGVKRVSKPGKRVYKDKDNIPKVLGGLGAAILSTSRGLMAGNTAEKEGVGGEVLCYIW